MGNILSYSGVATKVKAMRGKMLTDKEFNEMSALDSVASAVEYLAATPSYHDIFYNIEDNDLHRGYIEQRLLLSKYRDYAKLYRFSNLSGRRFLEFYFMHYEISLIKRCLRQVLDNRHDDIDLSFCKEFFDRHSKIDFGKLSESTSIDEFITQLQNSIYYDTMLKVSSLDKPTLFDYEMQLDLVYFKSVWKAKNNYLSKAEQDILTECFGRRLDMLNVQWIYRSKKYYNLSDNDIYALLIPINYKLKKEQIKSLVESQTLEEFFNLLKSGIYGSISTADAQGNINLEELYSEVMNRIYTLTAQKDPYSIASLNSYLYFKEVEIQRIITTIETIRYSH